MDIPKSQEIIKSVIISLLALAYRTIKKVILQTQVRVKVL